MEGIKGLSKGKPRPLLNVEDQITLMESNGIRFDLCTKEEAVEYLQDYYDIEHALPLDDTLDTLATVCTRNGGVLA
jgi:hypothetical protein